MSNPQQTIGSLAQLACTWEVNARKAGNVCPGREFPDLTVNDFLLSAAAIAPILDQAPHQPIGVTILRCIEETRKVVNTNTNLGIVLLLAPLASVPLDQPLQPGLSQLLARTTVEDSRNVYEAIRLAKPGGLGTVKEQDVREEPTLPLGEVMALAKERDLIAAQYATDFADVLDLAAPLLARLGVQYRSVERAIVETQLFLLFVKEDSLVRRKLGSGAVEAIQFQAMLLYLFDPESPTERQSYLDFDLWLRSDNHARNPGTTADLLAAALFVALRERMISRTTPFTWDDHPFQHSEPEA